VNDSKKLRLPRSPTAKQARERISEYLDLIEGGRQVEIVSRGKHVATLAPCDQLPEGITPVKRVTSTQIKDGKQKFTSVAIYGSVIVTRDRVPIAVLFPPKSLLNEIGKPTGLPSLFDKLDGVLKGLDKLELIDEARHRRLELRRRLDEAIRERIRLLRSMEAPGVSDFETAWTKLDAVM